MMIIVQKVSEYFTGLRDNHYKLRDDVSLFISDCYWYKQSCFVRLTMPPRPVCLCCGVWHCASSNIWRTARPSLPSIWRMYRYAKNSSTILFNTSGQNVPSLGHFFPSGIAYTTGLSHNPFT